MNESIKFSYNGSSAVKKKSIKDLLTKIKKQIK